MPLCAVCGEPFESDDPDEVILVIKPMMLETSERSGRLRMVECEFASKDQELNGRDRLCLHLMCMVDQLADPSLIGWCYEE